MVTVIVGHFRLFSLRFKIVGRLIYLLDDYDYVVINKESFFSKEWYVYIKRIGYLEQG